MKRLTLTTLALIALLALIPVHANASDMTAEEIDDYCYGIADFAEAAMLHRQIIDNMRQSLDQVNGELERLIVRNAYEEPAYPNESTQQQAAQEFANNWHTTCYGSFD